MQVLSFPVQENSLFGIRMNDVFKILGSSSLKPNTDKTSDIVGTVREGDREIPVHTPYRWISSGTQNSDPLTRILVVSAENGGRFGIGISKMGKVLRVQGTKTSRPGTSHAFLLEAKTFDGSPILIVDPDLFLSGKTGDASGPTSSHSGKTRQPENPGPPGATDDLISQIGKTAREIQKILSLSDTMIDAMKLMENNLPKTSDALEAVSKMTEEAAHKILGVLESAVTTNQEVRNRLSSLKEHPETLDQTLNSVHALLEEEEGRIMQGFEAMVFQDLVGQNIRQMTRTLNELEKKLLEILIEFSPSASKEEKEPEKATDSPIPGLDLKGVPGQSAISQDSVDKLLSEFGF